jgi:cytochrome c peroxidase
MTTNIQRAGAATATLFGGGLLIGSLVQVLGQPARVPDGEPIQPLSPPPALNAERRDLGEKLFRDPRLSRNDAVACVSCHRLDQGGDDARPRAVGTNGAPLDFNSPTVFNVALNFRFNWRGNFRTLEEQAEAVLLDPRLMNTTWGDLLAKLRNDPGYHVLFSNAYGAAPSRANVLDAIVTFERSSVTPDARFDRHLRGEQGAISAEEAQGYQLFKAYGCVACHQGVNVGGNLFQKFGIFYDPFSERTPVSEGDLGRFTITGAETDRHVFRVPSLRNVAMTAPYFHDGSAATLEEAIIIMARSQLGRSLAQPEVTAIAKFLKTLTGEYRGKPLSAQTDGEQQ